MTAAGFTEAADFEFVFGWREIVVTCDGSDELFEFFGMDIDQGAAFGAIQMMMVGFEGAGKLVALFPA